MTTETMHFRVEYLLREASMEPEKAHFHMQMAAEWMVKDFLESQVRARTQPCPSVRTAATPMLAR